MMVVLSTIISLSLCVRVFSFFMLGGGLGANEQIKWLEPCHWGINSRHESVGGEENMTLGLDWDS